MTSKKMAIGLTCCYFKHLGWPARRIMTNPILTAVVGAYMDTRCSVRRIDGFIRANALDMSDYVKQDYRCFNDFFTRQVKDGARPVNMDPGTLISPCDGYMSAYKISADSEFAIKDSYQATIKILCENKSGMLASVSAAIAALKMQICGINVTLNKKDDTAEIIVTVEIKKTSELDDLIRKLNSLSGIIEIRR